MKKAIFLSFFFVLLIFGLLFAVGVIDTGKPLTPNVFSLDFDEHKLFDLSQTYRANNGLPVYKKSDFLCSIASKRLVDIRKNFSHDGFYQTVNEFCPNGCSIGENLSSDWLTEEETMQKWIASPSHKENLDKPFTHSCTKTYLHYAVQTFGYF